MYFLYLVNILENWPTLIYVPSDTKKFSLEVNIM